MDQYLAKARSNRYMCPPRVEVRSSTALEGWHPVLAEPVIVTQHVFHDSGKTCHDGYQRDDDHAKGTKGSCKPSGEKKKKRKRRPTKSGSGSESYSSSDHE